MATCYSTPAPTTTTTSTSASKDYTRPLHVDCSVEYELPNQAKPPLGVRNEPLLMIHPCYFRKIESQRRSPFVNNLPTQQAAAAPSAPSTAATTAAAIAKRRLVQQPAAAAQYPVHYAADQHQPPDGAGKHILAGKYRQYLRAHRLHPYVGVASAIPLASTFPQLHQQVCYNV